VGNFKSDGGLLGDRGWLRGVFVHVKDEAVGRELKRSL
jgi:hypothetical protein